MKFNILIADDEKNIREGLSHAMQMDGYETVLAEDGQEVLHLMTVKEVDLIITDLKMPKISGEEILKTITASYPSVPVIILTGHGTIESAVNAMRNGAYDFLTKPVNLDHLGLLVKRALSSRELVLQHQMLQEEVETMRNQRKFSKLIGRSPQMNAIMEKINQVAPTKASVLITGESGVGKELVADALHFLSQRRNAPFIKVHCAALSESLLESELFGHEKGAFTGAINQKKGRFELANGGSIFLDEIGEITQAVQIKLLRVLQEKTFERVGGEKTIETDVRIIAATNKDLKSQIEKGNFREDLYYRLNVVPLFVPPLRERKDDIPLLAAAFLKEFAEENNKHILGFDPKVQYVWYNYSWPGNIRELRNSIENAVVMCKTDVINVSDLPPVIRSGYELNSVHLNLGIRLADAEKEFIKNTLHYCQGNKSQTAEILGISRKTLHRKIDEYHIEDNNL